MYQNYLADESLRQMMEKVDIDLARKCKEQPCERCGSRLHCDNYQRKPRGVTPGKRYQFDDFDTQQS